MMRTPSAPHDLRRGAALVAVLWIACAGAPGSRSQEAAPAGGIAPSPASVRVEQDTVVVEGRWFPIEGGSESTVLPDGVRLACVRAERSCKEDLTRLAGQRGGERVRETREYRVDEWARWGTPAGKLVAWRRDGGTQVEIRVSLSGLTAQKTVMERGRATRWRIE